eukprot:s740_g20.t1
MVASSRANRIRLQRALDALEARRDAAQIRGDWAEAAECTRAMQPILNLMDVVRNQRMRHPVVCNSPQRPQLPGFKMLTGYTLPEFQAHARPKIALDSRCRPWSGIDPPRQQGARLSIFGLMAIAATKSSRSKSSALRTMFRKGDFPRRPRRNQNQEMSCLEASKNQNHAFLMLKPHANNERAQEYVQQHLKERHIKILETGTITAEEIESKSLIDKHYGSLAEKAITDPRDLVVPQDGQQSFKECFGIPWELALEKDLICNAEEAQRRLGWTSTELGTHWDKLKMGVGKVKFGGGFYCGSLQGIFVINGFYMAMRDKYLLRGSSVYWLCIQWERSILSWKTFREEIVGETDPATAAEQHPRSIRGYFFNKWQELGLSTQPHVGDNVIHGSASPLEALTEKMTWLGRSFADDPFGQLLKDKGISQKNVETWQQNPTVEMDGRKRPLFDHLENQDTSDCLYKLPAWQDVPDVQGLLLKKPVHKEVDTFFKNPDLLRFLMMKTPSRKCLS